MLSIGRNSLTPIMLEALFFLCVNRECWGQKEVSEAIAKASKEDQQSRKEKEHEQQLANLEAEENQS